MQRLTYKGKDAETVLQRIINEHGEGARVVSVAEGRYGGVLGFFQQSGVILTAEVEDEERVFSKRAFRYAFGSKAPEPTIETFEGMGPIDAPPTTVEELLARQAEGTDDIFEVASVVARRQPPARTFGEALEAVTDSIGRDPVYLDHELSEITTPEAPSLPSGVGRDDADPGTAANEISGEREDTTVDKLRLAGYPAKLLAELAGLGLGNISLERAFTMVPKPRQMPRSAGSLIAIVGPANRAIEMATAVAKELQVDMQTIALATAEPRGRRRSAATESHPCFGAGFRVHDVETARDLAPGWRRDRVGVVAVVCGQSVASYPWARAILQAILPSYVCLVTKASAKNSDISRSATLLGGADALFLDGLCESLTPLSALEVGIPIARLEGETATQYAWTAIVESLPSITLES